MTQHSEAVLREAANILETGGWIQGDFANEEGAHCALGALMEAHRRVSAPDEDYIQASFALRGHVGEPRLAGWNDREGQTAEAVIAAFRETADLEATRGTV